MSLGSLPSCFRKVVVMAALAVLCACNANAAAKWTFMVYMDGDNNLESDAIDNFLSMAVVGGDADVNVVALFDRIPGYDTRYGDWTSVRRGEILRNDLPDTTWGEDLGELNMGDPATLEDFVVWAKAVHPAENYALVLWNHGSGWIYKTLAIGQVKGICYDDTSYGDCLNIKEIRGALEATPNNVTLLGMDACLMAMIEVADELQHCGASYMVSSEEVVPGTGWPYKDIVGDLVANPNMGPGTFATDIASRYYASYVEGMTMSVIQLDRVPDLVESANALSFALLNNADSADSSAVVAAAAATLTELDRVVVSDFHGTGWPRAGGMTIEFSEYGVPAGYNADNLDFVPQTHWADYLAAYPATDTDHWVRDVRASVQNFYASYADFVDFRDLCYLLSNYQAPQELYNERVIPSLFKRGGVAMGWRAKDGGAWAFDLPFAFPFNGSSVRELWVSSSGFLDMTAAGVTANSYPSSYYNENSFRNAAMVAPFWAPVNTAAGDIYVDTSVADRVGFRWVGNLAADSSPVEFQATLFASGQIRFDYGPGNQGANAWVGVSSGVPSQFTFSSYNRSANLNSARSSMLVPVGALIVPRDYNGDFKSDMLWATDKFQSLYLALLDGAYVDRQGFLVEFSKNWNVGGQGDFNGDCRTDLLLLSKKEGTVRVCLLDGFNGVSMTDVLTGYKGWQVAAVADFDGDGLSDFLLSRSGDLLMVLMDGGAIKDSGYIFKKQQKIQFLGVGDFDGDGKADLLTWDKGAKSYVAYLMNGLAIASQGALDVSDKKTSFYAIADLNGDGRSDLVLTRGKIPVLVLLNGLSIVGSGDLFAKNSGYTLAGVGDFNGDGMADLLFGYSRNKRYTVFLIDGVKSTGSYDLSGVDYKNWRVADVVDYNGDGKADIGFCDKSGCYRAYIGSGGTMPEVIGVVTVSIPKWTLFGRTH